MANRSAAKKAPANKAGGQRRRQRNVVSRVVRPIPIQNHVDPFVHCVLGPVNLPSSGTGAPTGSTEPSVVIDHRSVVTIKPRPGTGNVQFALVPGPYGCIAILDGSASLTVNTIALDGGSGQWRYGPPLTAFQSFVPATGDLQPNYLVVPFSEVIKTSGNVCDSQGQALQATKFRVLTTTATASFTGSGMFNQGSGATARIAHHLYEDVANPIFDAGGIDVLSKRGTRLVQTPPRSFTDVAALAGSRTFPARQAVQLVDVPSCFDFQDMRENWVPFTQIGEGDALIVGTRQSWFGGCAMNGLNQVAEPVPGIGYGPITYYSAAGLDDTSSITIDARCCVEYTLAFSSPAARFATIPAPERPLALRQVRDLGRLLPSSAPVTPATESHGWLHMLEGAASWYGRTMKKLIGASWEVGGQLMGSMPNPGTRAIGGLTNRVGQLMITG